jgi:hypothetical protein
LEIGTPALNSAGTSAAKGIGMDTVKGAKILRDRFERAGHETAPVADIDAAAPPFYRWTGIHPPEPRQAEPGAGTGQPPPPPKKRGYHARIAARLSR